MKLASSRLQKISSVSEQAIKVVKRMFKRGKMGQQVCNYSTNLRIIAHTFAWKPIEVGV